MLVTAYEGKIHDKNKRKNITNNGYTWNINGVPNWNNRQIIAIEMKNTGLVVVPQPQLQTKLG